MSNYRCNDADSVDDDAADDNDADGDDAVMTMMAIGGGCR